MRKVSVIIPVVRPEKARRCMDAAFKNAGIPADDFEVLLAEDEERIGCPKMVARLVEMAAYDLVCFLGDDTIPQPDFLKHALAAMDTLPDGWGMVGLNDGKFGEDGYCTHWVCDKRLLPMLDGAFFATAYGHTHCDRELKDRCQEMGRYVWAKDARIVHDHPAVTGAPADEHYRRAYDERQYERDRDIYERRKAERKGEIRLGIGLPLTDETVPKQFFTSFTLMDKPGNYQLFLPRVARKTYENRNQLVAQAYAARCTHLCMMDTDQVYPKDTLVRLMACMQHVDIAGVRVHRRYPPFDPIMYRGTLYRYTPIPDAEAFSDRLIEVDATGTGCLMIAMRVFDAIPRPWFQEIKAEEAENGREVGEDIYFCHKATTAGFRIGIDTSIAVDHLATWAINRYAYEVYKRMGTRKPIQETYQ